MCKDSRLSKVNSIGQIRPHRSFSARSYLPVHAVDLDVDSGDDFMNFPMIAEDILPLIEGDDDSLDTLMLGFE